jgi:hypothetical protein
MDFSAEVEAALSGAQAVPKADYDRWIRGDLATRARVYRLTATAWHRITPEPGMREHCTFMAGYLTECITRDPAADGFLHGGFEAARELAAWLKHLGGLPEAAGVIDDVARRLAVSWKDGDPATRNRIETGALEHILESPRLRPHFRTWAKDRHLRSAYEPALAWGLAHPERD